MDRVTLTTGQLSGCGWLLAGNGCYFACVGFSSLLFLLGWSSVVIRIDINDICCCDIIDDYQQIRSVMVGKFGTRRIVLDCALREEERAAACGEDSQER